MPKGHDKSGVANRLSYTFLKKWGPFGAPDELAVCVPSTAADAFFANGEIL